MSDSWIRRLQSGGRAVGDAGRLAALGSIIAAVIWWDLPEIGGFTIVFLGLLVPRFTRLPGPFDAAFCLTIMIAAWSGVAGLYKAISWWDLVVHFTTAGASAATIYLVLARFNLVRPLACAARVHHRTSIVVLTAALGLSAAVLWEFCEWAGHRYLSDSIHVGYVDTIGDLAVGGLGSVLAGTALAGWAGLRGAGRQDRS